MRIFSYITGVVMLLFSIVQLNDPDALIWVIAYLIPATVAFLFSHRKFSKTLLFILAIAYLIIAIVLFPPSFQEWIHAEEKAKSLGNDASGNRRSQRSCGSVNLQPGSCIFRF